MSRVLSLALVLVMLLGIMPLALAADPDTTEPVVPTEPAPELIVTVNPEKVAPGGDYTITVNALGDYTLAENPNITWPAGWDCTPNGNVANCKATTNPGSYGFTVSADVVKKGDDKTVRATGSGTVVVEAPVVTEGKLEITGNNTVTMVDGKAETELTAKVTATPDGYTLKGITWSGEGIAVGTTGEKATFTATKANKYTVTAEATFEKAEAANLTAKATFEIEVTDGKVHATMADVDMTVSEEGKKVEVTFVPADMKDRITVAYSSSDSNIIEVDANGNLNAKRDGKVTITAKLTAPEGIILEKNELTCTVKATAGAVISCADEVTDKDSVTLTPVLKDMNGKVVEGAKFSFEIGGKIVESKASSYTVKRTKQGVTEVIVRVAEYPNGDVQSVSGKRVLVSFYDTVDATVHIAKDTFMFDDTGVFSAVEIGNRTQINPKNFSMTMLWNNSGVDYSYIKLKQDSTTTRYGVISYPGSDWNAFVNWKEYSPTNVKGLKFTGLEKGKVVLEYELTEKNLRVQEGTITIVTSETGSDITYRTTYGKSITFNEMDFQKLWNKQYFKSDLSYVMFDAAPDYGNLYRDKQERNKVVYAFDEFYIKAGRNELSLSDVTYAPDSSRRSAYDVSIPFTMYGKDSKDKYNGVLTIKMNDAMPFRDVNEKDWFYNDVQYVYTNDIMNGLSAYEFGPQNTLTRGMVVTMLHRMEGKPRAYKTGTFTDVASGTWYTEAVEWAAENNIVNGYGTTFGPNNNITRQDLAVILYRYAQYKKMNTYSASSLTRFSDYQRVASYATNAMEWAVYNKIMNGNDRNMLSPAGNATRAEAAKMFHVFLELK